MRKIPITLNVCKRVISKFRPDMIKSVTTYPSFSLCLTSNKLLLKSPRFVTSVPAVLLNKLGKICFFSCCLLGGKHVMKSLLRSFYPCPRLNTVEF